MRPELCEIGMLVRCLIKGENITWTVRALEFTLDNDGGMVPSAYLELSDYNPESPLLTELKESLKDSKYIWAPVSGLYPSSIQQRGLTK